MQRLNFRSPGSNGIPIEFYETFGDMIQNNLILILECSPQYNKRFFHLAIILYLYMKAVMIELKKKKKNGDLYNW